MIRVNKDDVIFMLSVLDLSSDLEKILESMSKQGGELTEDLAYELRDLCTDRLDTHGFDLRYEPTEEGKKLEALIDKLFIG